MSNWYKKRKERKANCIEIPRTAGEMWLDMVEFLNGLGNLLWEDEKRDEEMKKFAIKVMKEAHKKFLKDLIVK